MGIIINGQNDTIGPVDNTMSLLGTVSIGGTMTIEDFTNIDSVGIITAQSGIHITSGGFILNQQRSDTHASLIIDKPDAGTGTLKFFNNGSSSAYIQHTNAEHLNYYLPSGSGYHSFYTNGTEALRITSAGLLQLDNGNQITAADTTTYIGLGGGNSTSNGANMFLYGGSHASNASAFVFRTNTTERLRIFNDGSVRIGDSSIAVAAVGSGPTLAINGSAPEITLRDSASNNPYAVMRTNDFGSLTLEADQGNNAANSTIHFRVDNGERMRINSSFLLYGDTASDLSGTHSSMFCGSNHAFQYDGDTGTYLTIALGAANGTVDLEADARSGGYPDMRFITTNAERLRITSDGKVGIGTNNPNSVAGLDVLNGEICARGVRSSSSKPIAGVWLGKATGGNAVVELVGDNNSTAEIDFTSPNTDTKGRIAYNLTNNYMYFYTNGANERLRIDSSGNVGINESNPRAKFDVRGTALIADDIGSTLPSTFPASDVQLMVYTSTNGQPIGNTNCARILLATDAKQTGPQGYNGAIDFGNSDATAAGQNSQYNYRVASIMSQALADTESNAADGNLEFWTKTSTGSLSQKMGISAEGYVTKPNHPCFDAVRNSGHISTQTYINFNTVKANNGGHYNSSNGRFTAPVAGYYFFSWTSIKNNTNTVTRLYIHKNGSSAYGNRHLRLDQGQDYGDNGTMTAVIQLAENDYVQIYLGAGSIYGVTEEYCIFNGYLLG